MVRLLANGGTFEESSFPRGLKFRRSGKGETARGGEKNEKLREDRFNPPESGGRERWKGGGMNDYWAERLGRQALRGKPPEGNLKEE